MSTSTKSKVSRQDRVRKIIAGATKHFQPSTSFTLAGASYTLATLTELCQKDIGASDAATQAKAAWLTIVQTEHATNAQTDPVLRAFKAYVVSLYGDTQAAGETLADFGYTPRKVATKSVATKAAAASKVLATRKARGTLGPKAKLSIKGTVTAPVAPQATTASSTAPPPTTASATPVTPASPASPAATASTTATTHGTTA